MVTILENLRQILGEADFFVNNAWNYGSMIEYFVGAVILCIVITSVFRFIGKLVS